MGAIYFLLSLVKQFVELPEGKFEEIKGKAENWYNTNKSDLVVKVDQPLEVSEQANTNAKKWYYKAIWTNEQWWFQLLLACYYIFASRNIAEYIGKTNRIVEGEYSEEETE